MNSPDIPFLFCQEEAAMFHIRRSKASARGVCAPPRARLCCEQLEDRCLLSASLPSDLTPVGDRLYFVADDGIHGRELFTSDGTAAGTHLVRDIRPGAAGSDIRFLAPFGDRLLFTANDGAAGFELWITDGTPGGTNLVKDINRGKGDSFPG